MSGQSPRTTKEIRRCPHCGEDHQIEKVVEPGWEQIVYCPRTGVAG